MTEPSSTSADARYLRRGALSLAAVALGAYAADYGYNLSLTHLLSPHAYGDIKVATSFAAFFGLAVLLGGDRAAPMVLAPSLERGARRQVWEYLRFYLGIALLLGVALAAVTWIVSYLREGTTDPRSHHPITWVVLVVPLNAAGAMISRLLQSARHPAQATLPWRLGLPLLQLATFGVVVVLGGRLGVEEAVVIGIAAATTITAAQWLLVRRLGLVELAREPGFGQPGQWLGTSLPMMGTFLVALALNQSDIYFLEMLGDEAQVGHFAAAATAAHLLLLVQTTLVGLVAPVAKLAIEEGGERSRATYRQGQKLLLAVAVPLAAGLVFGAGPILSLFGAQYRAADTVLVCLAAGGLAWAAAALSSLWLQYQGHARTVLAISIATLVADCGLDLLLIPRYGMNGAAASTAVALLGAAVATIVMHHRRS